MRVVKPNNTKGGVVIETILILLGIGLIVHALMVSSENYKFTQTAQHSEGTILSSAYMGLSHNIQYAPPGQESGAVFVQHGPIPHHALGDHVPVLYDPQNMNMAKVEGFATVWFDPIENIIVGLVLIIVAFRVRGRRSI
jgi:hypothetical protein